MKTSEEARAGARANYWRNREQILERARLERRAKGIPEAVRLTPEERKQRRRESHNRERERAYKQSVDPEKRRADLPPLEDLLWILEAYKADLRLLRR
jgi:hypothetical protein